MGELGTRLMILQLDFRFLTGDRGQLPTWMWFSTPVLCHWVRCKAKLASEELLVRGAVVWEKYVGCSLGRVIP